jgi:signal transduction histidine kinase
MWWFRALAAVAVVAILFLLYRARVRKLLAFERLRTSIATDLHDDIGSTLTEIALYSDAGLRHVHAQPLPDAQTDTLFQEIGALARGLVDAMSDIVWAIDPKNDSFEFLLLRMKSHATTVFEAKGIAHDIDIPPELAHLRLPLGFHRGFFLVFKEAITNVLRHSQAQHVWLSVHRDRGSLVMEIRDNGKGFAPATGAGGNGLLNMQRRARDFHGTVEIASIPSSGTTVTLRAPLP